MHISSETCSNLFPASINCSSLVTAASEAKGKSVSLLQVKSSDCKSIKFEIDSDIDNNNQINLKTGRKREEEEK